VTDKKINIKIVGTKLAPPKVISKSIVKLMVSDDSIINKIYFIRGKKVMLDSDLAELYGVETKQLKRAVRRNIDRFPDDFMFEMKKEELQNLRCQFGTSSWGGIRYIPMAFTEQGVAMLSSVLNSEIAIKVNIQIIRVFSRMRELILTHKEILSKLEQLEKSFSSHDESIEIIFNTLKELLNKPKNPRTKIGYRFSEKEEKTNKLNNRKIKI